jgi:hypothetical protein
MHELQWDCSYPPVTTRRTVDARTWKSTYNFISAPPKQICPSSSLFIYNASLQSPWEGTSSIMNIILPKFDSIANSFLKDGSRELRIASVTRGAWLRKGNFGLQVVFRRQPRGSPPGHPVVRSRASVHPCARTHIPRELYPAHIGARVTPKVWPRTMLLRLIYFKGWKFAISRPVTDTDYSVTERSWI